MKLISLYKIWMGSLSSFTRPFQENEALYNQAKGFWRQLEGNMVFVVFLMIIIGVFLAYYYYKPYNDRPGRHYTPKHWLIFLGITFVLTFLITWGCECFLCKPVLKGASNLEMKIAFGNAVYASILYFFSSLVWCNFLPTNACRFLKL